MITLAHLPLGAKPFTPKPTDLAFAAYLGPGADQLIDAALAPAAMNWHKVTTATGDMPTPNRDPLNNHIHGNCVLATGANGAMFVSQMAGAPRIITGAEVDAAYKDIEPDFDPVTGAGDHGTYPVKFLTRWTQKDYFGTRCRAFCKVDESKPDEVALALFLAGWLFAAYDLPLSAQDQVDSEGNPDWRVDPNRSTEDNERRGWGGHAYAEHALRLRQGTTWGLNSHATEEWCRAYTSSLHMALLRDWRLANGRAPNGFDFEQLLSDARARGAT